MNDVSPSPASAEPHPRGAIAMVGAVLALLTLAAYHNSLSVPFLFDDLPAIVENPSVRRLSDLAAVLAPNQAGLTTSGRPLLNLSFALNYATSGTDVWAYHATNIAIHVLAGLSVLGIVRRTLLTRLLRPRFGAASLPLAAAVAALWLLHPLQTESVTYLVQRAESLAGLFLLLTLYTFVRATRCHLLNDKPSVRSLGVCHLIDDNGRGRGAGWLALSVGACGLGVATKEIVAMAPLVVLLYDRTFVAGDFRAAWRARRGYYAALGATWLVLGALVLSTGSRGGTAGFGTEIPVWSYALTQCRAIVRYLALSVWPHPLVFDYGDSVETSVVAVLPHALALALLLGAVGWALVRRPVLGFVGAWFLLLLAPSSSVVPIATQTMAEHRMYLPLAAVLALLVGAAYACAPRWKPAWFAGAAVALATLCAARNRDYATEVSIWSHTAAAFPANARAHNNLGQALFRLERVDEAVRRYRHAAQLNPRYPEPHYNLGVAFARLKDAPAAEREYRAALGLQPAYPEAHNNLGNLLASVGRADEARRHYDEALRLRPDFAEAHHNLGQWLLQANQPAAALDKFDRAIALRPDYAEAHFNRGNALAALERMPDALWAFEEALRRDPRHAEAHVNAGNVLFQLEKPADAVRHYEQALGIEPAQLDAELNLGFALLALERWSDAAAHLDRAARSGNAPARVHHGLGFALAQLGRRPEAAVHYREYLKHEPRDAAARAELAELERR